MTPSVFVGRETELATIGRLLADPACRLLTVVGPGGMGKTCLALEAARRLGATFPDGIYIVSLQPLTSTAQIVPAMASAIGLRFSAASDTHRQLLHHLRDQRALLVLDNVEHLLDSAPLLSELVSAAPACTLLATSRERLNLVEEWTLELGGLSIDPTGADAGLSDDDLSGHALQLFAHHARKVRPDFSLAADRASAARICRLVGGSPLAIELAAGWVRVLSCAAIADEIERGLDILRSPARNMPPRHSSMSAVLDSSWAMLAPDEQEAVRRLAVFRGGFTRATALAVAGVSLDTLAALADKSWMQFNPASARYDLHELLRHYGEGHLSASPSDSDEARRRHAAHFSAFMRRQEDALKGREQRQALDAIERELNNVHAAWRWAIHHGHGDLIDAMVESLTLYSEIRCDLQETAALLDAAEARFAPAAGEPPGRVWGRVLIRNRRIHMLTQSRSQIIAAYDRLHADLQAALTTARDDGDDREIAWCLYRLSSLEGYSMLNYDRALALASECLDHCRAAHDILLMAHVQINLFSFYANLGQIEPMAAAARECLTLAEQTGNPRLIGSALRQTALIAFLTDPHDEAAERDLRRSIQMLRDVPDVMEATLSQWWLAMVAFYRGDLATATTLALDVLASGTRFQVSDDQGRALGLLGLLAGMRGDDADSEKNTETNSGMDAETCCHDARHLLVASPYARWVPELGLAIAACNRGDDDALAARWLQAALHTTVSLAFPAHILLCLPVAALLLANAGELGTAVELWSLVHQHPAGTPEPFMRWTLLAERRAGWPQALGADGYAAAWARGATRSLDATTGNVLKRLAVIANGMDEHLPRDMNIADAVTDREIEILRLMADGYSNRAIANALFLSVATVKWYNQQIFGKLGVSNRTHAVARARELNVLA